ncbi:MAG: tRNA lysidine(34) synthetase TilS, partial [Anaerolineae bacterium]
EQGQNWLSLDRKGWRGLHIGLKSRVLRRVVTTLRPSVEIPFNSIQLALEMADRNQSGQAADLPGGVTLLIEADALHFRLADAALPIHLPQLVDERPIALPIPGAVTLAHGWRLSTELVTAPSLAAIRQNADPWVAYLAVSDLSALQVRSRLAGERMQPLGMNGRTAKLQDVMMDRKIPARLRALWPLVAVGKRPLWLAGHILDEQARVTETNEIVVKIRCFRE